MRSRELLRNMSPYDCVASGVVPERYECLNVGNKPDQDGIVRGRVLPEGARQSTVNRIVALSTMILFMSWPYFMLCLFIASARPSLCPSVGQG